jgi:hypothetical protein
MSCVLVPVPKMAMSSAIGWLACPRVQSERQKGDARNAKADARAAAERVVKVAAGSGALA